MAQQKKNKLDFVFPQTIDRTAFGWYLSGFTDGEGCFSLLLDERKGKRKRDQPTPCASFAINLRRDDDGILKLIQSYLHGGTLVYGKTRHLCSLRFRKLSDLSTVVQHFDMFPLFAKKAADFKIWRDGVILMLYVVQRTQKRSQRYGSSYKWTPSDHELFVVLKDQLEQGRKFKVGVE